jgi:hypothetical protein
MYDSGDLPQKKPTKNGLYPTRIQFNEVGEIKPYPGFRGVVGGYTSLFNVSSFDDFLHSSR